MAVYLQTNQPVQIATPQGVAYAVSASDTGKLFLIGIQAQGVTITLPALAAGLHFRFQAKVTGATMTADVLIRPVAGLNVSGLLCIAAANPAAVTGATSLSFMDFYCDGVQWSVIACSSAAGGITQA